MNPVSVAIFGLPAPFAAMVLGLHRFPAPAALFAIWCLLWGMASVLGLLGAIIRLGEGEAG